LALAMYREGREFEEYGYVLDFLAGGVMRRGHRFISTPVVQLLGESMFTILEATVRPRMTPSPGEKLYIGKGKRDVIDHVLGRIGYEDLTPEARDIVPIMVEGVVRGQEQRFIRVINEAQPLSPRMHSLELFTGIGKALTFRILQERAKRPFDSFKDLAERVNLQDPAKIVVRRVLDELEEEQRYRLFTRPY